MPDYPVIQRWRHLSLLVLLAAIGALSFVRAYSLRYDFHHFYRDARYVWTHGELNPDLDNSDPLRRRQLPFYLPAVPLLLAPLTAWGLTPAAVLWAVGQTLCLAYGLKVLAGWTRPTRSVGRGDAIIVVAGVLALPALYEAARFNQLSFPVLALTLAAIQALERDRVKRAGVWLALATVLKLLPAVFGLWLALKRKWAALAAYLVGTVVLAVLPCLVVFGPQRTAEYHRQWWALNVRGAPAAGMVAPELREHFLDHRNQSVAAVIARLAWPEHPYRVPWQPVQLSEATCRWVARGVLVILGIGLLWTLRGTRGFEDEMRGRGEVALGGLALLVFSPLLRQYYLVWALPAVVLFTRFAGAAEASRARTLARIGLALWVVGMVAWLSDTARAYGAHLVMLLGMGALLAQLVRAAAPHCDDSLDRPVTGGGRA